MTCLILNSSYAGFEVFIVNEEIDLRSEKRASSLRLLFPCMVRTAVQANYLAIAPDYLREYDQYNYISQDMT